MLQHSPKQLKEMGTYFEMEKTTIQKNIKMADVIQASESTETPNKTYFECKSKDVSPQCTFELVHPLQRRGVLKV